jgi:coenzyme F420-reducing hydrogenase delta subunit
VEYTRELLERVGIEGQRLQMINVSAAMAGEFTFSAAEITAEIQRLGPNPLRLSAVTELESRMVEDAGND